MVIKYQLLLLAQSGFLDHEAEKSTPSGGVSAHGLTWQGHEFLEAVRNDDRWERAKQTVLETATGVVLELIKTPLMQEAEKALGMQLARHL